VGVAAGAGVAACAVVGAVAGVAAVLGSGAHLSDEPHACAMTASAAAPRTEESCPVDMRRP
jgi:hypothetical protein